MIAAGGSNNNRVQPKRPGSEFNFKGREIPASVNPDHFFLISQNRDGQLKGVERKFFQEEKSVTLGDCTGGAAHYPYDRIRQGKAGFLVEDVARNFARVLSGRNV